jgi:hypothetical protein
MMRRAGLVLSVVVCLTALTPAAALGAKPLADEGCGPGSIRTELPAAPEGFVAVQEFELTADCRLVKGKVEIVPAEALVDPGENSEAQFSNIAEEAAPPDGVSVQGAGSGCCWGAYAVQRTWDCCGILLNEYWTEFDFNRCSGGFCSPYLRTYSASDGGKWHWEGFCGPGWYPNSSDRYLYRSAGGVGYTSVTISGHQGFGYDGGFDCGGNDYYNSYWNSLTGHSNGNWSCSYTYSWRKSLGFQYQAWCGSGDYGQK